MVFLGRGRFLMSEVPLYEFDERGTVQGYLAQKKQPLP